MHNLVIGTAGHIDHGKTTLVKALTGIDTDRLKEEKMRGITIELGFAHLTLPGGKTVSLVDVPGHERFIKNMLAGAAGIDMALLVVAADEGVMPQTREHLDILKLLEIPEIIVVISKTDLVEPEIAALAAEEVAALLEETAYHGAPVVSVSAYSKKGLAELIALLDSTVQRIIPDRKNKGLARLPADRVFTLQGIGTVVTGTLFNGEIKTGDILEVPVSKKKVRIRNLQVYNKNVNAASAGQRVAANLAGADAGELARGDVLVTPDRIQATNRIDVHCHLLKNSPRSLFNMTRVRFHQGTGETLARVFLLDRKELLPGDEAFIQLVLEHPAAVLRGDTYIIRSYSPVRTIGGGRIVEPHARKHPARESGTIGRLKIIASGGMPETAKLYMEDKKGLVTKEEISRYLETGRDTAGRVIAELVESGQAEEIIAGDEKLFVGRETVLQWEELISREIKKHLQEYPLEPGADKELLRARFWPALTVKEFNSLVSHWAGRQKIALTDNRYLVPFGHEMQVDKSWLIKIKGIEDMYIKSRWQIPGWDLVRQETGIDEKTAGQILRFLLRTNKLIHLGEDCYLWHSLLEEAKQKLKEHFMTKKEFSVAEVRDLLDTSRKVAIPLLEYLDRIKFTQRVGETRKLIG